MSEEQTPYNVHGRAGDCSPAQLKLRLGKESGDCQYCRRDGENDFREVDPDPDRPLDFRHWDFPFIFNPRRLGWFKTKPADRIGICPGPGEADFPYPNGPTRDSAAPLVRSGSSDIRRSELSRTASDVRIGLSHDAYSCLVRGLVRAAETLTRFRGSFLYSPAGQIYATGN
jgi:hypothetical protein